MIEKRESQQPPERRVDAAEVPEIDFMLVHVDELRNLAVRRLMPGKRPERGCGFTLEQGVARERHADRAHRRVAGEYGRVTA